MLSNPTYSPRTSNPALNQLNQVHFVAWFLGTHGPSTLKQIYAACAKFRGLPLRNGRFSKVNHMFSGEYGYVSRGFTDLSFAMGCPGYMFGTNRKPLWYRTKRGTYALNYNGYLLYQWVAFGGKWSKPALLTGHYILCNHTGYGCGYYTGH